MRIGDQVEAEAVRLVRRWERYAQNLHDEFSRRNRRSGGATMKTLLRPSYWSSASGFDPYLVRSRSAKIAEAIDARLLRHRYAPRNAVTYSVPKSDGSPRRVSVFQIADSAVSRIIFQSLRDKNRNRFSGYSFAYRNDLTVHDAVQHIAADLIGSKRMFVAEYDFSKYFDSISHDHLWRILTDRRFLVTALERSVIEAFLSVPTLDIAEYSEFGGETRTEGVPQGTSLSLFLANVAAWELDRSLERLGVGFARFADDTLIWSQDYSRISEAAHVLNEAAQQIGANLNLKKSDGISILAPPRAPVEFQHKSSVEFVGYSFTTSRVGIRRSAVARIKNHISGLVFHNLIEQPLRANFNLVRIADPIDRDYVTMHRQIRRFMYGDLSEERLVKYLNRSVPLIRFKGVMAFYPLVDDEAQLKEMDGWLVRIVHSAMRKRAAMFTAAGVGQLPPPHGLTAEELIQFRGTSTDGSPIDLRLPSFSRISRLLYRAATVYGPNKITDPRSTHYYHPADSEVPDGNQNTEGGA
jgi:RNA-directed DNA polymerase